MKTKNTVFQNVLEIVSILAVVAVIVLIAANWSNVSNEVPLHYNIRGEADRWGSKAELLICPILGLVMYGVWTLVAYLPKIWNLPVEPTSENKAKLYSVTKTMLLCLKLETVFIFGYISLASFAQTGMSSWFLPVICTMVFSTLGYYIYKQVSIDRQTKRVIKIDSEVTRLKKTFPVSKFWLIGPCVLTAIPFFFVLTMQAQRGKGLLFASLIAVEVIPICIMYFVATRMQSKFYSENSDINMALNRVRVRAWTRFWVLAAYNAAISGAICFSILLENGLTLTTSIYIVYFAHVVLTLVLCGLTRMNIKNNINLLLEAPTEL